MHKLRTTAGATLMMFLASALAGPAAADRAPTAEERAKIEAILKADGFVSWEEIEGDDKGWEVDDARHSDGTKYDLKLEAETFAILSRNKD
jgi:hypothetical protein